MGVVGSRPILCMADCASLMCVIEEQEEQPEAEPAHGGGVGLIPFHGEAGGQSRRESIMFLLPF